MATEKEFKYMIDLSDGRVMRHGGRAGNDLFQYANTIKECKEILESEGDNFIRLGNEFKKMAKQLNSKNID